MSSIRAKEELSANGEPQTYGRYEIVSKLATGGMGEVYLARALGAAGFAKYVVIKRILPHLVEQPRFVEGLVREAKLLLLLDHPNIVQVLDLGVEGEDYFMAMEFVPGYNMATVAHYCAQRRHVMPVGAVASVGLGVLGGLEYAHELVAGGRRRKIVHRDVSPQNVMLSREGRVKLTDFGIAKVLGEADNEVTGGLKGKLRYMAPEVLDRRPIDQRYDLFATGILLYEGLCRRHLFGGRHDAEILEQVRACKVGPIEHYHPGVQPELVDVIHRALARDPADRFQTAREFARALRDAIQPVGEADAAAQLRDFIAELYERPDFPINRPKLPDPDALDPSESSRSLVLRSLSASGTLPPPPGLRGARERQRQPRRASAAIALLSFGLLAISGVVAFLAYTLLYEREATDTAAKRAQQNVIVVHEKGVAAAGAPPEEVAASTSSVDLGASLEPDASSVARTERRVELRGRRRRRGRCKRRFTQAIGRRVFARHGAAIKRCYRRNSRPGAPPVRLVVVQKIARSGRVAKVDLRPARLTRTGLGRCLSTVAKRMIYPCHGQPEVLFSQPLNLTRR